MIDPASTIPAAAPKPHPLLERLLVAQGCPEVTVETLEAFGADSRDTVLFFAGDPVKYPETLDVAVILPQLGAAFRGRFIPGVVMPWNGPALQPRFGFNRWPALVFQRGGQYIGAITGVRNWGEYLAEIQRLLGSPPRRAPTPGIALAVAGAQDSACH